jgi:O-antigen ligase
MMRLGIQGRPWQSKPAALMALTALLSVVVALADPSFTLVLAVSGLMAWLGWGRPAFGLGVVAATIPLQEALTVSLAAGSVIATRLVLIPFIFGWIAAWLLGRRSLPITAPLVAWVLIVGALALSIIAAVDRAAWAQELYRWSVALALYVIAVATLRQGRDAGPMLTGTVVGILGSVAVATWQVATATGPATFQSGGIMRAYGFFGEPNPLAAYLEMTVLLIAPLAIMMALRPGQTLWRRFGLFAIAGAGGCTLLLTQSRGGLLGFAAGSLVVALLASRLSRELAYVGIILAVPLLLVVPAGRAGVERFAASVTAITANEQVTSENWSVQERVAHWKAGLHMLETYPLTGVGAGNYNARYREMTTVWRFRIPRGHAHHSALQMGAQAGYTGLIVYMVLLFTAGARILRGVKYARLPVERALAVGALGVLVAVIVHGQFDYLHGLSLNLAFALAIACAEPSIRSDALRTGRRHELGVLA